MQSKLKPTEADEQIRKCIESQQSFSVVAGAGSGKTESLVSAMEFIRQYDGARMRLNGQNVLCITYTNHAVQVLNSRLQWDGLYKVNTIHEFMWSLVRQFQKEIRNALTEVILPQQIEKQREKDNGSDSKAAVNAREMISCLEDSLRSIQLVETFTYGGSKYANYAQGELSHDDVIDTATIILSQHELLRRIFGSMFPYVLVDEAQDTFESVVTVLNLVCSGHGLPLVGYFGDPMQQIYENRAGTFHGPAGFQLIKKPENYRSSRAVIRFLNSFRDDIEQVPGEDNADREGSVLLRIVQSEKPTEKWNRYNRQQLEKVVSQFDTAMAAWGWYDDSSVKLLFLARQMIARRLGFSRINDLFTGEFASGRAQQSYEHGQHYLLEPFIKVLYELVTAVRNGDEKLQIQLLSKASPAFSADGINKHCSLADMVVFAKVLGSGILSIWETGTTRSVLDYCRHKRIIDISARLQKDLDRKPREESYDEIVHEREKGDWLADLFFSLSLNEIDAYCEFIQERTAFGTQHGVKGGQYPRVVVTFDDAEASWSKYNFVRLLTPQTSGSPTVNQYELSRRLAYVCFSRAQHDLRILLFHPSPESARNELLEVALLKENEIEIVTE